jgi:hypothetical protein
MKKNVMPIQNFDPKELEITSYLPSFFGPASPLYNFPVSPKDGQCTAYAGKPVWQITNVEQVMFAPKCNPDNVSRALVFDGTGTPPSGGADMFGIEWEYIHQVGGSMVRPGKPLITNANEIFYKVKWPDIEAWDWEGCAKANTDYLSSDKYVSCWFLNGWYERLISFMDFEGAVVALIDEDQKDAVKTFFEKLSELYIRIVDKHLTYFPQIDGFYIHDDWGSQKETFFSPATAAEMIVPYMRRVTDFIHSKGRYCELHSCGQLLKQVPNIIAAGWDCWGPQVMNDTHRIYELYGDKMLIAVMPEPFDPERATEEEQRAAARTYANRFCRPDKPSVFNLYGTSYLTPVFREELYKQSRINYGREA